MTRTIRVGIIGVNAEGGWARDSHVPAVLGLDGLELVAIAANSAQTAEAAAAAFSAPKAYANGLSLIGDPEIDLVAVTTRVPDHTVLVLAALAAGKHVYCEWPLGCGVAEAQAMATAARQAGVHTAIGLQLRASPAVRQARDLIADGAIGRLLGLRALSTTAGFGPAVVDKFLYLEDPTNFANLVTITGAHTIDAAIAIAGPLSEASALASRQYPMIRAGDASELRTRTTFDHLLAHGRFSGSGTFAVEIVGGCGTVTPFRLEAMGETGRLQLDGGAQRGGQSSVLRLSLNDTPQRLDAGEFANLPESATNVAGVYASLRDDIRDGTFLAAGFDHAVALTRLTEDFLTSSETGRRINGAEWPTR